MEQVDSSQFVPGSLASLRRTSTGSLNAHKRTNSSHSHDYTECLSYYNMTNQNRRTPIAGGSWDDNSVGHGSVAARMRRERNRAIRTQSNVRFSTNSIDTHANITSTLNLINTTALSPWQQDINHPWDNEYSVPGNYSNQTAASRRTAGSLCNIHSSETNPWDSRSIPEYPRMRSADRSRYRNSFTCANHQSCPTSGCASIAGSDIDSADLAFFSMTDDSSFFDGDSLFSESYGMIDADSGFSTNIFSMLEEGTISCRTPFPNGDWPDSISELDFDCSEQQPNDISNCDAHSDIGPSCSAPTDRNRLKKRQVRSQTENLQTGDEVHDATLETNTVVTDAGPRRPDLPFRAETDDVITAGSMLPVLQENVPQLNVPSQSVPCNVNTNAHFSLKTSADASTQTLNADIILDTKSAAYLKNPELGTSCQAINIETTPDHDTVNFATGSHTLVSFQTQLTQPVTIGPSSLDGIVNMECDLPPSPPIQVDVTEECDTQTVVNCDVTSSDSGAVQLLSSMSEWNSMTTEQKLGFVEQLSERINKTMGLQEQLDIIRIIGTKDERNYIPFHLSIENIDCTKLSRVLGYLDTHKTDDSPTKIDEAKPAVETNLRRSNSDGNISKSVSDAQKEHRRRQRQARRFAKWLKQRQRKENRQHMKEQRSGLFLNEKKLKIQAETQEDVEVEV